MWQKILLALYDGILNSLLLKFNTIWFLKFEILETAAFNITFKNFVLKLASRFLIAYHLEITLQVVLLSIDVVTKIMNFFIPNFTHIRRLHIFSLFSPNLWQLITQVMHSILQMSLKFQWIWRYYTLVKKMILYMIWYDCT